MNLPVISPDWNPIKYLWDELGPAVGRMDNLNMMWVIGDGLC